MLASVSMQPLSMTFREVTNPLTTVVCAGAILVSLSATQAFAQSDQVVAINTAEASVDASNGSMPSPLTLLDSMADAMESLNYTGEYIHVVGGTIESMRIVHASTNRGEFERLTSLNGEAREVFRSDEVLTCIWPGSKSIIVGTSKARESIPRIDAHVLQSDFYNTEYRGYDRVASRDAHVIEIRPVDEFRYGYRFWIDSETSMLLRMVLVDSNDKSVEQLMFTSISFPDSIDLSIFETDIENTGYKVTNMDSSRKAVAAASDGASLVRNANEPIVEIGDLPGGYQKVSQIYDPMPIGKSPLSHITISDGMASVSVYVEHEGAVHQDSSRGMSTMGAVNAFAMAVDDAFVTVVGEVPAAVVEAIGYSVQVKN